MHNLAPMRPRRMGASPRRKRHAPAAHTFSACKAGQKYSYRLRWTIPHGNSFHPYWTRWAVPVPRLPGIGYMFTYEINRLLDRDAHASADHRFSYQFSWNLLNDGQDQGDFVDQGLYLSERYGIMTEQDYGISGTYQFKWATDMTNTTRPCNTARRRC